MRRNDFFKYLILGGGGSASRVELESEILPYTFVSKSQRLKDYRIYGNTVDGESVGDLVTEGEHAGEYLVPITVRGKNLFNSASNWNLPGSFSTDGSKFPGSILGNRRTFFMDIQPNTTYTLSFISCGDRVGIAEYGRVINPENYSIENKLIPDRTITPSTAIQPGESYSISFTTASNAKMVGIYYSLDVLPSGIQIEIGNTATEYEPYHKPIKVNLYITEPLVTGDSVSFKEIGTAIPTISGTNIITVETTVQPSKIWIQGNISEIETVPVQALQANMRSLQPLSLDDEDLEFDVMPTDNDLQPDVMPIEKPVLNLNDVSEIENAEIERGVESAE